VNRTRIVVLASVLVGCDPPSIPDDTVPEDPAINVLAPAPLPVTRRLLVKPKAQLSTAPGQMDDFGGRLRRSFDELGVEVRDVPAGMAVEAEVERYLDSDRYEYVEPDYPIGAAATPNDPSFSDGSLWNLHNTGQAGGVADADIDGPEAWSTRADASSVIVAVADSGINTTHEDLAANLWKNPGEIPGNGLDDDHNGIVDDVYGLNAINDTGDVRDDYPVGHGTHVAGIIAAVGNNGVGVTGVAWKARLLTCKMLDANGSGNISDAIACLAYARSKGAKVLNMSFQGPYSLALRDAIAAARKSGLVVVTAAGNAGISLDKATVYPVSYDLDNLISVAATDRTDQLASFSNFGAASVDLAAPGVNILSTHNASDSAYVLKSGTSMAAPHVTAAIALMRAQTPSATYTQIINRLFATVDKPASLAGKTRTGGRLNLARALSSTATRPINDKFAGATIYPVGACITNGSNADATSESGEPAHAGLKGGKSIWWSWTAPITGKVTIATDRSNFDTLLGVYTGASVSSLTRVAGDDNAGSGSTSKASFTAKANTTYWIAVDGRNGATGEVSLAVLQQMGGGSYTLVELGEKAMVLGASEARRINNAGEVVGYVERTADVLTAFRRAPSGGFTYLPTLGGASAVANSINGNGEAAGWSQDAGNATRSAVLWKKDGTAVRIGRLPGFSHCAAYDINDSLRVVGACSNSADETNPRAFVWASGVTTDLGATDDGFSSARGITNGGRIVGKSTIAGNRGVFRAVEWVNGGPLELTSSLSEANDISAAGSIVGTINAGGVLHPMLVQNGMATDLTPGFTDLGQAMGINGAGTVVGIIGENAALFRQGAAVTLNGLVAWDSCGGNLFSAESVNDSGQIVGQVQRLGVPHAYLAVPIARPLAPVADSYVRDGHATTNFGTAATMETKLSSAAGTQRLAYLRFDLGATAATTAKLRLFGTLSATSTAKLKAQVFASGDTTWSETGITWNNRPATTGSALDEVTLANSTTGQWYEWDVSAFVRAQQANGRTSVTLVIKHSTVSTTYAKWNSRENAANQPQLLVTQ
jgi:subtilisin family serine protease